MTATIDGRALARKLNLDENEEHDVCEMIEAAQQQKLNVELKVERGKWTCRCWAGSGHRNSSCEGDGPEVVAQALQRALSRS